MAWTMIRDYAHGFDCQPIKWQVQSYRSLLMSFDWLAFKVRCRVIDHCLCHLIGWHSNPGAESLIIVHAISVTLHLDWNANQSNGINNDQWLCIWLWMPTNQMTLTMIHDSAPDFECQPIKWHEQWSMTLSWIIVHVIWLVGIQSQVQSHGSLFMSFDWLAFKVRCRVMDHC
jgi:hypothetical protein